METLHIGTIGNTRCGKKLHTQDNRSIKKWCNDNPRSVYVTFCSPVNIHGTNIKGSIKSCNSPCLIGIAPCHHCVFRARSHEPVLLQSVTRHRKPSSQKKKTGNMKGKNEKVLSRHGYATKLEMRAAVQKSTKQTTANPNPNPESLYN